MLFLHQEFFSDLSEHQDKHKLLNDSANFLIEGATQPVADEIKRTILLVNRRFTEVVEGFQSFHQNEIIGKAKSEYEKGVDSLAAWLTSALEVLGRPVRCIHAELKAYLLELDVCAVC